jgi:hypothetical protein
LLFYSLSSTYSPSCLCSLHRSLISLSPYLSSSLLSLSLFYLSLLSLSF